MPSKAKLAANSASSRVSPMWGDSLSHSPKSEVNIGAGQKLLYNSRGGAPDLVLSVRVEPHLMHLASSGAELLVVGNGVAQAVQGHFDDLGHLMDVGFEFRPKS